MSEIENGEGADRDESPETKKIDPSAALAATPTIPPVSGETYSTRATLPAPEPDREAPTHTSAVLKKRLGEIMIEIEKADHGSTEESSDPDPNPEPVTEKSG